MCDPVKNFAGKELSKEEIDDCVIELRSILDADEKFQNFRKDDSYLLRFLYCTDFNVHLTYRRVDDYYNYLIQYPEWYARGSLLDMKEQVELLHKGFLKDGRDKVGRRIFIAQLKSLDPEKITHMQNVWLDEFWFELVMDEPETRSKGVAIIIDVKDLPWNIVKWFTPSLMKIASKKMDLFPCKELVYHIVNTSMFVNMLTKLVWPFLPTKITAKFNFYYGSNFQSLHEHINPKLLPPEYGGTGDPLNYDNLNKWLFENSAVIEEKLKHHALCK